MKIQSNKIRIAIFFGGPSNERNISLDSARTFFDSVRFRFTESNIHVYFVSKQEEFYLISPDLLYSNTIEDFESNTISGRSVPIGVLIFQNDVFCPLIHGAFGEDGRLTKKLEILGCRSILGSGSTALNLTLDKFKTNIKLKNEKYKTAGSYNFKLDDWKLMPDVVKKHICEDIKADSNGKFIVKPNNCGSSDGVSLVSLEDLEQAINVVAEFSEDILIEERIIGDEFSIIVIQDKEGRVIPLIPTGIHLNEITSTMSSGTYSRYKKYMPGTGATHVTPMNVHKDLIQFIRDQAHSVFKLMDMRDWARFDGFVDSDGDIVWSDLNGIPGYGQDSFFFQQASLFNLAHTNSSLILIESAARRGNFNLVYDDESTEKDSELAKVAVVGGGQSSEKNVSRMSWMNVIQKLQHLRTYQVVSIFQDGRGVFWKVPLFVVLQHTIEEIESIISNPKSYLDALNLVTNFYEVKSNENLNQLPELNFAPERVELKNLKESVSFVFIALHGGDGENGTFQAQLDSLGIPYNGCNPKVSRLCMNKFESNSRCKALKISGFLEPKQLVVNLEKLKKIIFGDLNTSSFNKLSEDFFNYGESGLAKNTGQQNFRLLLADWIVETQDKLNSPAGLVIKPMDDGCSSGVLVSFDPNNEVLKYLIYALIGIEKIPLSRLYSHVDSNSEQFLQMPASKMSEVIVEQLLSTRPGSGFVEMTVGVLEKDGVLIPLSPSETPSNLGGLTVEEKFNKGFGTNLTPPKSLTEKQVHTVKSKIKQLAEGFEIRGYARIDVILDLTTDDLYLIEVNSLPGLTPATVIYTQAIFTDGINMRPSEFLSCIVQNSI